jgi:hypothetical protein
MGIISVGFYLTFSISFNRQVRNIPLAVSTGMPAISLESAASLPAVAATALHAISQAGGWPDKCATVNKAALVHRFITNNCVILFVFTIFSISYLFISFIFSL